MRFPLPITRRLMLDYPWCKEKGGSNLVTESFRLTLICYMKKTCLFVVLVAVIPNIKGIAFRVWAVVITIV